MGKALRACARFDARLAIILIKSAPTAALPAGTAQKGRAFLRALRKSDVGRERSALGELE
jgi:hypothetical protein